MAKIPINELLAANLAEHQRQHKWTQKQLAAKCGVDQKTISNFLTPTNRTSGKSGKSPSATLASVEMLADALEVEVWELLSPLTLAQKQFYRGLEGIVRENQWPTVETRRLPTPIRGEGKDFQKPPKKRRRKPGGEDQP